MKLLVLSWLGWLTSLPTYMDVSSADPAESDLVLTTEMQASAASGQTPLWLQANRYGVGGVEGQNGYLRVALSREMRAMSREHWALGYGADVYVAYGAQSTLNLQQLYVKGQYKHLSMTVGQREEPAEMLDAALSTGGQTLGINARPIPGIRLAVDDYWSVPGLRDWLGLKGHVFYGMHTDGGWNEDWAKGYGGYYKGVMHHTKAGYLRVGGATACPVSLEAGLQMASLWGGSNYNAQGEQTSKSSFALRQLLDALTCKESNIGGMTSMGNVLGSWVMKLNYEHPQFDLHLYADCFFERRSGMFWSEREVTMTDADGSRYSYTHRYPFKDKMLGLEGHCRSFRYVNGLVFEYLNTRYQQGPIGHESSSYMPEVLSGYNSYYNHGSGSWTHWGQVLGNPLYRSPIYNEDHRLNVQNNRFVAWHIGLSGDPIDGLHYRLLMTCQRGWGTYDKPYIPVRNNVSLLAEVAYQFGGKANGLMVKGALGSDGGEIMGNNLGMQLTLRYTYGLKLR